MKEPEALEISHQGIGKIVSKSFVDGMVKSLGRRDVFGGFLEDEDLLHVQDLAR